MMQVYHNGIVCSALFWGLIVGAAQDSQKVVLVAPSVVFGENLQGAMRVGQTAVVGMGKGGEVFCKGVNALLGSWSPFKEREEALDWENPHTIFFNFLNGVPLDGHTTPPVVPTFCGTPIPPVLCALLGGQIDRANFQRRATEQLEKPGLNIGTAERFIIEGAIATCADPAKQADLTSVYPAVVRCLQNFCDQNPDCVVQIAGNGDVEFMRKMVTRNRELEQLFGTNEDRWILSAAVRALCPSAEFFNRASQRTKVSPSKLFFVGTEAVEQTFCDSMEPRIRNTIVDPVTGDGTRVPVIEKFLQEQVRGDEG